MKFRFLEWDVYKDAQELVKIILNIVKNLPREYRFELGSQLIRSAFSVVLNIAEGSGKGSDKDFNKFLDISLGSLYEVLAGADTLKKSNLISTKEFEIILKECEKIADQLGGFKKKLKSSYK
jgi:four helix bundle protein